MRFLPKNLKCILPISVASGLLHLETLEIEDAAELQYVFGDDIHEKDQNLNQISIDLSAVKIFNLINLKNIISIYPQNYDMKLPLDKAVVTRCPRLSGISDLDSEVRQQDGDEAMKQAKLLSMSSGEDLRLNIWVRTLKDLAQAMARQARYFYRFNTLVIDLTHEKDLLMSKLDGIPVLVGPSGDPQQQVQVEVGDLIEKVEMLERKAEASQSCCHGYFPNWLGQYIVGKRLERMTKMVKQFNERLTPNHGYNITMFESTKRLCDEILEALKDDKIYMIRLCGIGGCGKTSLIIEVRDEVNSLKLFDVVAFVAVPDPPDIRRIQGAIAYHVGFTFNSDENEAERAATLSMKLNNGGKFLIILDAMWEALKLEDVGIPLDKNCKVVLTTRLQHICPLMGCQKMFYLSLLSEEEAWILFQKHAGVIEDTLKDLAQQILRECDGLPVAIIAMARAVRGHAAKDWMHAVMEDVCKILELSIDHLEDDEARSLFFLCALFPKNSNIALETLIRFAIGLGILKEVDSYERARIKVGAIIDRLIGSCLLLLVDEKRQYFRMHNLVREVALKLAKKIQVIKGPEENPIALTEGDYMKDTTRLYCHGINEYPNQLNCPKLDFLFVYNDGGCSSNFSATFLSEMIELKVLTIIDTSTWKTPNLLLPQSMDGLKKLRTVCLRGWTLNNISVLGKLEMLDTIQLLYCVIKELPEELTELRRLRLLEVSGCKIGSNPFEVLTRCSQLEELYFVENSLPEMVSNDHNVVKLLHQIGSSKVLRRYHLQIGSSIDSLKNDLVTKFISVNGSNIPASNEDMKNVGQKLEVLFLENVQGDCKNIFPDMIPIDGEGKNKLTEFLLHDSDNIECLIDTSNHPLHQPTTVFSKLKKLKIKTMKCFKALCCGRAPINLFEKLEELFIVECSQLHCFVSVGKLNFCNLKHLKLEDCPKLTSIFTYSTAQTMVLLEILKVRDCISLKQIIKDEEEDEITPVGPIFPKLKQLYVMGCPHLKFIIPESFHGGLPQLSIISDLDSNIEIEQGGGKSGAQELEPSTKQSSSVVECKMEGIFQLTKPAINMETKSLLLSCVQSLVMENLPNLRYISDGHKQLHNLRRVKIYKCGELKCIFSLRMMTYISALRELIIEDCSQLEQIIEHEDYDGEYTGTGPFSDNCNLQKITVKSCPMLGSLFTVSTAKTLRLMRTLKIEECPGMKVLLKDESAEAYGGQAIFPNLSFLSLKSLPELIHVCEEAGEGVMFPESFNLSNLQSLTVRSCPRLRSLFTVSTAKTLMWLNSLEIIDCSSLEYVIKGGSKEIAQGNVKEMLPKLNILHLVKLPSLIIIHQGIKLQCGLCQLHDPAEELIDFHCLFKIKERQARLLRDHQLKQLYQLESQITTLEENRKDARASLASVKDDLSKPGHVFGF